MLPDLNHDVVLGVDWLAATNPTIDWQACTVALDCVGSVAKSVLSGLPNAAVARVELCSLQTALGDIRKDLAAESWLMLLQPATTAVGMEPKAEDELGEVSGFETETSRWNNVVADYPDVFAEPGMPAERETKHKIELLPGATPPYRR